jgi:hypothetical protein
VVDEGHRRDLLVVPVQEVPVLRRALSLIACSAVLLFLVPGLVQAAAVQKGEFEVSPTIGFTVPFGDLGDVTNPGFAIGVQGLYYLSPKAGLGGSVVYNKLGSEFDNIDFSITEVQAIGKLFFNGGSAIDFYGKGAVGLYVNSVSGDNVFQGGGSSNTEFGIGAGAGLQKRQGDSWGWFGEAMLHFDDFDEIYLALRAGANFYFGGTGE